MKIEEELKVAIEGAVLTNVPVMFAPPATLWTSANCPLISRPVSTVNKASPEVMVASKLGNPTPAGEVILKPDGAMVTVPLAGVNPLACIE